MDLQPGVDTSHGMAVAMEEPRPLTGVRMLPVELSIDLELVAQRILKLAEVATLEHLASLEQSQAQGLMDLLDGDVETV